MKKGIWELLFWLLVIIVSWYVISSCSFELKPKVSYTNVKRGCRVTTIDGFKSRTDVIVEGCNCGDYKTKIINR